MSANTYQTDMSLLIRKEQFDALLSAFSPVRQVASIPLTLMEFLEETGDGEAVQFNADGVMSFGIVFEDNRYNEAFVEALAPFVENGGWIEFQDEHADVWRVVFWDGKGYEIRPRRVWPDMVPPHVQDERNQQERAANERTTRTEDHQGDHGEPIQHHEHRAAGDRLRSDRDGLVEIDAVHGAGSDEAARDESAQGDREGERSVQQPGDDGSVLSPGDGVDDAREGIGRRVSQDQRGRGMTPDPTLRARLAQAVCAAHDMEGACLELKVALGEAQDEAWNRPRLRQNGYVDITLLLGMVESISRVKVAHDLHHLILRLYPEDDQEREDQEWGEQR